MSAPVETAIPEDTRVSGEKTTAVDLEKGTHEHSESEAASQTKAGGDAAAGGDAGGDWGNGGGDWNANAGPARDIHGWKWVLVCASLYITAFTYGLDTTIAADVQSAVTQTFGSVELISWLATGFLLGAVATILFSGRIYERFNAKWVFIGGVLGFEVGSVICGAAPNMNALIVGRVIAGVGGANIYLGCLQYMTQLTSEKERGGYIGGISLFWGLGCVLGPVIGGAFASSNATWRWAFYINLLIAVVCAPGILIFLPSLQPQPDKTIAQKLSTIDWVGVALNAGMWAFFIVVMTFGGPDWAYSDPRTIALWVLFGVFLLAFCAQQGLKLFTTAETRLFPVQLLNSRTQILLVVGMAAHATCLFIPIYYIPIYFQFVHGDSAIVAAVRLLPFVIVSMVVNFAIGGLVFKVPHYAILYLLSGLLEVAGGAAMYTVGPETSESRVYGYSILIAVGAGLACQIGYTLAAVKLVKQQRWGDIQHGVSLQNITQIGAGVIALTIASQVFQAYAFNNLSDVLAGMGFTAEDIHSAVAGTQSDVFQKIDANTAAAAVAAITSAMSKTYILVIVGGALSVLASFAMRWERLFS